MTLIDLAEAAFGADPVVCAAGVLSVATIFAVHLLRAGMVNTGFIFLVFSTFGTLATCLKLLWWIGGLLVGVSGVIPPGGTDLLLVTGALFAFSWHSLNDLSNSLRFKSGEKSRLDRILSWLTPSQRPGATVVQETDEARNKRQLTERSAVEADMPDAQR